VLGESGCGKTTLVRCLAGLLPQDAGTVVFAGEPLPPAVLRDGRTVEAGPAAEVLTRPAQPYTAALLAAAAR
jgi:ABC-type glutathione transport system ATPase component